MARHLPQLQGALEKLPKRKGSNEAQVQSQNLLLRPFTKFGLHQPTLTPTPTTRNFYGTLVQGYKA